MKAQTFFDEVYKSLSLWGKVQYKINYHLSGIRYVLFQKLPLLFMIHTDGFLGIKWAKLRYDPDDDYDYYLAHKEEFGGE